MASVEMTDEFDVEAVGAVDVAQEDDRKIAFDVVFHLDELLLIGSGVGRVRDGEIARDLLLDGDARGCVRFGRRPRQERVHAEVADAEKMFDASAESAGDRFGEQSGGTVVLPRSRGRAQGTFLARAANREQRNNV